MGGQQPVTPEAADGEPLARQFISAAVGYPDEFLLRPVNETLLRHLAERTGGQYNPGPANLLKDDIRTAGVESELWPWLLGLAATLFAFDVAAKRWPDSSLLRSSRTMAPKPARLAAAGR